jgi:hypothetical protein
MDTQAFYTGPLLGMPHQYGRNIGPRHHPDACTLGSRTFLNSAFWLWYFWAERILKQ